MDKVRMIIWGRPTSFNVIYECYGNQEPTTEQTQRLQSFLSSENVMDSTLSKVKQYCLEDENIGAVKEITNIFKYVMPTDLYVKRDNKKGIVALLCDYVFDVEHGIAVVFEDNCFKEIVMQGDL